MHTGKLELIREHPVEVDIVNYQIFNFTCSIENISMNNKYVDGYIESISTKKVIYF